MLRRIPKRFSLRGLFIAVTLAALALGGHREWQRLRSARKDYEHTVARWQFRQITILDVADAADELYEVESSISWIPHRTAARWQVERLHELAEEGKVSVLTTMFGTRDGMERFLQECDQVEARADVVAARMEQ
jgi:hypothetical protein